MGEQGRGRSGPEGIKALVGVTFLAALAVVALPWGCATTSESEPGEHPDVMAEATRDTTGNARQALPEDLDAPLPRDHLPARTPWGLPEDDPRRAVWHLENDEFRLLEGMPGAATACMKDPADELCAKWDGYAAALLGLAQRAPADRYVMGQVVYSLVRGGRQDLALAVVDDCAAAGWWCQALRVFVLTESGRTREAEAAFDDALGLMPDEWLCAFTDVSPLMSDDAWKAYEGPSCRERLKGSEGFWVLADPAWAVPGNDRRAEHYDRVMWGALHDDALWRGSGGGTWPGGGHTALHQVRVVRYGMDIYRWDARWGKLCGWPAQFRCSPHPDPGETPCFPAIDWPWTCPYAPEGQPYHVIPEEKALLDPFHAGAGHWPLAPERDPESYVVRWGGRLLQLDGQVAFFERGDSLEVAAAMEVPADSAFQAEAHPGAFLFLYNGSGTPPSAARRTASDGRWVFRVRAPRRRYVVGIEAVSDEAVGRLRLGHGLPHDPRAPLRLSDLLLYTPRGAPLPDSLAAAVPLMKGSRRWQRGDTIGVFLEVYGPDDAASFPVSVELEREREPGLLARLGEVLGMAGGRPTNLRWSEPGAGGRFDLSFTVDLRNAQEGDYTLRVSVGGPGMSPAVVEAPVEIVRASGA